MNHKVGFLTFYENYKTLITYGFIVNKCYYYHVLLILLQLQILLCFKVYQIYSLELYHEQAVGCIRLLQQYVLFSKWLAFQSFIDAKRRGTETAIYLTLANSSHRVVYAGDKYSRFMAHVLLNTLAG